MQFTYQREDNDYWIKDILLIEGRDVLHWRKYTGNNINLAQQKNVRLEELVKYLDSLSIPLDNFQELENYFKENYPKLLPKSDLTEKELLENLINKIDSLADTWRIPSEIWAEYKAAKLYLDPEWSED